MLFNTAFFVSAAALVSVSAAPLKLSRRNVDPNLVPQFGIQAGVNPTGTGDCDGVKNAAGVVVKIPCSCPPNRDDFIASLNANVAAGHAVNNPGIAVSFPTDNSQASQLARLNAATVTLQNLRGPGVGCPSAATTFNAQADAIRAGTAPPPPPPSTGAPPPPPPPPPPAAPAAGGVNPALVPQFGIQAGVNPTGTGDCDGTTNPQGVVVKIPCSCPPNRDDFIAALNANVAAGHAVNNPGIAVSFPEDDSKASKLARLNAATVTLQNLRGPGVGCPSAATTFNAQAAAIQNGP
ncbi:hypothetical protein D9613_005720 [Agrocybe pediades]|uniref:Uncharacterized protein n=1 Tax=Agrocybe pediades TaxID=84607 RepID=A0A8H4QVX9_9AGAR|nr:hypothetical protein D9613_005720 [Agrocybe pediades]KAF9562642.1 hypothetical protein CPC08DRAFT_687440 [Agrocybe pediades]